MGMISIILKCIHLRHLRHIIHIKCKQNLLACDVYSILLLNSNTLYSRITVLDEECFQIFTTWHKLC